MDASECDSGFESSSCISSSLSAADLKPRPPTFSVSASRSRRVLPGGRGARRVVPLDLKSSDRALPLDPNTFLHSALHQADDAWLSSYVENMTSPIEQDEGVYSSMDSSSASLRPSTASSSFSQMSQASWGSGLSSLIVSPSHLAPAQLASPPPHVPSTPVTPATSGSSRAECDVCGSRGTRESTSIGCNTCRRHIQQKVSEYCKIPSNLHPALGPREEALFLQYIASEYPCSSSRVHNEKKCKRCRFNKLWPVLPKTKQANDVYKADLLGQLLELLYEAATQHEVSEMTIQQIRDSVARIVLEFPERRRKRRNSDTVLNHKAAEFHVVLAKCEWARDEASPVGRVTAQQLHELSRAAEVLHVELLSIRTASMVAATARREPGDALDAAAGFSPGGASAGDDDMDTSSEAAESTISAAAPPPRPPALMPTPPSAPRKSRVVRPSTSVRKLERQFAQVLDKAMDVTHLQQVHECLQSMSEVLQQRMARMQVAEPVAMLHSHVIGLGADMLEPSLADFTDLSEVDLSLSGTLEQLDPSLFGASYYEQGSIIFHMLVLRHQGAPVLPARVEQAVQALVARPAGLQDLLPNMRLDLAQTSVTQATPQDMADMMARCQQQLDILSTLTDLTKARWMRIIGLEDDDDDDDDDEEEDLSELEDSEDSEESSICSPDEIEALRNRAQHYQRHALVQPRSQTALINVVPTPALPGVPQLATEQQQPLLVAQKAKARHLSTSSPELAACDSGMPAMGTSASCGALEMDDDDGSSHSYIGAGGNDNDDDDDDATSRSRTPVHQLSYATPAEMAAAAAAGHTAAKKEMPAPDATRAAPAISMDQDSPMVKKRAFLPLPLASVHTVTQYGQLSSRPVQMVTAAPPRHALAPESVTLTVTDADETTTVTVSRQPVLRTWAERSGLLAHRWLAAAAVLAMVCLFVASLTVLVVNASSSSNECSCASELASTVCVGGSLQFSSPCLAACYGFSDWTPGSCAAPARTVSGPKAAAWIASDSARALFQSLLIVSVVSLLAAMALCLQHRLVTQERQKLPMVLPRHARRSVTPTILNRESLISEVSALEPITLPSRCSSLAELETINWAADDGASVA